MLFGLWILLSGRFDAFHLLLGVFSSAFVSYMSCDLLFARPPDTTSAGVIFKFIAYIPWLCWQVFLANVHVLRLAFASNLHERLDPHIIRLQTRLKSDVALVTLANSITLTPGTITIFASTDGDLSIHALDRTIGDVDSLHYMENKVFEIFERGEHG